MTTVSAGPPQVPLRSMMMINKMQQHVPVTGLKLFRYSRLASSLPSLFQASEAATAASIWLQCPISTNTCVGLDQLPDVARLQLAGSVEMQILK